MNVKTLLLVIAITVTSVLLGAIYINVRYFFYLSGIEILSAITVISASYSVISISSLILVCKMRKEKEKKADIKILSAIAVISALIAVFLFTLLILLPKGPEVPEKPVFIIKDEAVREDLIRRGLMGEYPNGTRYVNLSGVEELIKKGVYRTNPDGTLELVHVPSE